MFIEKRIPSKGGRDVINRKSIIVVPPAGMVRYCFYKHVTPLGFDKKERGGLLNEPPLCRSLPLRLSVGY
jgi:hypothetical protein